ncbi:MAG: SusD/RagB family nutrient-binding outer membrane lipoprotein [Bacteroidota bacterium]
MWKKINIVFLLGVSLMGCQELNKGVNDNPNDITIDAIAGISFLTGTQLGNIHVQVGHLQRISALWTRQLSGFQSSYLSLDQHNITTAESNSTWNRAYHSVLSQLRTIQEKSTDHPQLVGITYVMEAHTIGTMASIFGDVPYAEAATEGSPTPVFDPQVQVFEALLSRLDEAIGLFDGVENELVIPQDIYYQGSLSAWRAAAYTLKARFYLQLRKYPEALEAAENGIQDHAESMLFHPIDDTNTDNKNLFWQLAAGSRAGDIGNLKDGNMSYLLRMLSDTATISRSHAKTDERARFLFYILEDSDANANQGVGAATQPMPLLTFAENQLILAEAVTRTQGFLSGLDALNVYRAWLDSGDAFRQLDPAIAPKYGALDEDDFEEFGLENPDELAPETALLREIIEERYVSGFGTWMPYNDARRLREREPEIAVAFPVNPNGGSCLPQRFLYAANELDANPNAPADPGLCAKTPVNQ